jgi:hypothetical protein
VTRGDICQFKGCQSTNTETEVWLGVKLTLCEKHGHEQGERLMHMDSTEFRQWRREHLK